MAEQVVKKSNNRERLLYRAVILIALIVAVLSMKRCNDVKEEAESSKAMTEVLQGKYDKETKFWRDKAGNEHATAERVQLEKEHLLSLTEELTKQLKVKPKQIESVTTITTATLIDQPLVTKDVYYSFVDSTGDTIQQLTSKEFSFVDTPWVDIHGEVCIANDSTCKDSIHIELRDTLIQVDYWKRTGFLGLGQKKHYVDISNRNPHIHITGIRQLELATQEPKVLIAPFVGFGWGSNNVINRNPYPELQLGIAVVPYKLAFKIR